MALLSRSDMTPVQRLQADAREDYVAHNRPETVSAAREQHANAQIDGNAAAGFWHGRRT